MSGGLIKDLEQFHSIRKFNIDLDSPHKLPDFTNDEEALIKALKRYKKDELIAALAHFSGFGNEMLWWLEARRLGERFCKLELEEGAARLVADKVLHEEGRSYLAASKAWNKAMDKTMKAHTEWCSALRKRWRK